jgi:hypothetical protein
VPRPCGADVLDHHDGVVDHEAGGQVMPNRVRVLIRTRQLDEGEGSDERHRDRTADRVLPSPETGTRQHHEDDGEQKGPHHLHDRLATTAVVSNAISYFAGGRPRQAQELRPHQPVDLGRVGPGELGDADADRLVAVEAQAAVLDPGIGAAHVPEPHEHPVRTGG